MRAVPFLASTHVEHRVCSERGNLPHLSQRDQEGDRYPQEVLNELSLRDRRVEAPSPRARAPAAPGWPGRRAGWTSSSPRRLCLARHALQREKHGVATATSWLVGGRMRPSHWRFGAIGLQLGGGQGSSARSTPASDLRAQKTRPKASEPDPGKPQGRIGAARLARQLRCSVQSQMDATNQGAPLLRVDRERRGCVGR